jgi:hypothetical protein
MNGVPHVLHLSLWRRLCTDGDKSGKVQGVPLASNGHHAILVLLHLTCLCLMRLSSADGVRWVTPISDLLVRRPVRFFVRVLMWTRLQGTETSVSRELRH